MLLLLIALTSTTVSTSTCTYGEDDRCAPLACLPPAGVTEPQPGDQGTCGKCTKDADCGLGACAIEFGTCTKPCSSDADCGGDTCRDNLCVASFDTIWPRFSLATLSASVNTLDAKGSNGQFGLAAGFYFMGAFSVVTPKWNDALNTWQALETPRWFFHVGAQLGADGHFALADLGFSFYYPALGGVFMTYGFGVLYERRAEKLFDFKDTLTSEDRLGGGFRLGIFYNLFFRAAYVAHLRGALRDHGALLFTLEYTTDFIRTAVPDQYAQYVLDAVGDKAER